MPRRPPRWDPADDRLPWSRPLPRQVQRAARVADHLLGAGLLARGIHAARYRRGQVGRGAFRVRADITAEQNAMREARKRGRGAFRSQTLIAAALAAARGRPYGGPARRRGRSVMWVTDGPRPWIRRKHRATGRHRGRPRHRDAALRQAVADLRKTFCVDRREAEDRVITTMLLGDLASIRKQVGKKRTQRWWQSMRARLR